MSIRGLAIPAAIAIAGAVAGLAPATAMAASPAKAANNPAGPSAATRVVKIQTVRMRCSYSAGRDTHNCFYIASHGLEVAYMAMASCVNPLGSARTLHEEITGPSFTLNSRQVTVRPGHCFLFRVPAKGNLGHVAAGTYQGITWRYNGGSSYTPIADLSLSVHR
jgi:hypothetical protein